MRFSDHLRKYLHLIIHFWISATTYNINGTDVGFECDCGYEIGDVSWGQLFSFKDKP